MQSRSDRGAWALFLPKLVTVLREGYSLRMLRADALAGLTVAIVALPLAMALAIASGVPPERGLVTAVVAGFLISALGGSRFQIGGPTGAFVVIVFSIVHDHGYDGLVIATLMAGIMLLLFGLARLGTFIKYIPYPVVTGFTAGIALIIFSSQVVEILGLRLDDEPPGFLDKWHAIVTNLDGLNGATLGVAALTLAIILGIKRFRPGYPVFLIGITIGAVLVWAAGLPVETIGTRFGGIPRGFEIPSLPVVTWDRIIELFPAAFTIALLAGIESLLSAVVADGMTGRKHRSNCELVGQGVANVASALAGGIPATGAIARTATNVRSGAHSPVSGMLHAVFLLVFVLALAPLASYLPLASLGAVLVVVAWNMSEHDRFRHLLKAPPGDRLVLLVTFGLTVLVDLTVAIQVGVVMAAILFMHRMTRAVEAESGMSLIAEDVNDLTETDRAIYEPGADHLGAGGETAVYRINGPFFFGVAGKLSDVLDTIATPPRLFIIDMTNVPVIDATGVHALEGVIVRCHRHGTRVILAGVKPQPRSVLQGMGLEIGFSPTVEAALPPPRPAAAVGV
ncbi:SulP family inorganic anion transporter [Novispirillum sp. DQ9]|uniref:SulP family inorganic anion transporter n=1 Tax=Novispirillum sp. DQ9 TaxID=3398612 RepID=UPI003C7AE1DA